MDRFNTFKLFIQEHKNKIIVLIIFLVILSFSTIFFLNIDRKTKTKTESIIFSNSNQKDINEKIETISNETDKQDYIYVDVKGEVNLPGVYSLVSGKRVVDAINIAGGLKENASTTFLNLSLKLTDQMVIIVYSKDEINNQDNLKQLIKEQTEICNKEIKNDSCIVNNPETIVVPDLVEKNKEEKIDNNKSSKVNINSATIKELITLPKIGETKGNRIITYREQNGNFKTIEEIKNVKGIGDTLFESIKDYITI